MTDNDSPIDVRSELHKQLDAWVKASETEYQDYWKPFRDRSVRMMYDDQLADVPVRASWARVQLNEIYPAITQENALHVERLSHSDIKIKALGNANDEAVEQVEGRMRWHFRKGIDIPSLMSLAMFEGKLGGNYICTAYWDPEAEWDDKLSDFKGSVKVELLDTERFVIDPDCGYDLTQALYMGTIERRELKELVSQNPERADEITAAALDEADEQLQASIGFGMSEPYVNTTTQVTMDGDAQPGESATMPGETGPVEGALAQRLLNGATRRGTAGDEVGSELPRFVTVLDIYFKDFERDKNNKPAYPFGRNILRIGSGQHALILNDTAAEQGDDPQRWWMKDWPYVVGRNQLLPSCTWRGMDSITMLKGSQDLINDNAKHFNANTRLHADPILALEDGALAKGEKLTARPGAVWRFIKGAIKGQRFQRIEPAQISVGLFEWHKICQQNLRDLSGVHETIQGKQRTNATATEVLQLQTNSRLRVGAQSWYGDRFIMALLLMVMRIEMAHMEESDKMKIIDNEGAEEEVDLLAAALDLDFDIEMQVITALPWDSERTQEKALALFQAFGGNPALARMVLEKFKDDLGSDVEAIIEGLDAAMQAEQEAAQSATAGAGNETGAEEESMEDALPPEHPAAQGQA